MQALSNLRLSIPIAARNLKASAFRSGVCRRYCKGDVTVLSQAVTLVESVKPEHQALAQEVIERCLPYSGELYPCGDQWRAWSRKKVPRLMSSACMCWKNTKVSWQCLPSTPVASAVRAVSWVIRRVWSNSPSIKIFHPPQSVGRFFGWGSP